MKRKEIKPKEAKRRIYTRGNSKTDDKCVKRSCRRDKRIFLEEKGKDAKEMAVRSDVSIQLT